MANGVAKGDSAACLAGLNAAIEKASLSEGSFLAKKLTAMAQDLKARGSFLGMVDAVDALSMMLKMPKKHPAYIVFRTV